VDAIVRERNRDVLDVPAFTACIHEDGHVGAGAERPEEDLVRAGTEVVSAACLWLICGECVAVGREELGVVVVRQVLNGDGLQLVTP
jgi:hypothetical protein